MERSEAGMAHLILVASLALVLVGGVGVSAASNSSKPGDALYGIDRAMENVQVALALTNGMKADVHRSIAEERLQEVSAMLAEKNVDAPGIANALANFDEHKAKVESIYGDDGKLDDREKEIKGKLEHEKSSIDKKFEGQQKSLEQSRESLKQQYEQALKSGDTVLAAELKAKIDGYESLLKDAENAREAEKQASEAEKKAAEQAAEDAKQAQEATQESETETDN